MAYEHETLGALLSDARIAPVAADAIRRRDLKAEPLWRMTLGQLKSEHFFSGEIGLGIARLYRAADSENWYFPLYSEDECAQNAARRGVSLVWFPSEDPAADARPCILVVPGGGFVNVWNLTEGWPIAEQFNRLGYHAFILTYQVEGGDALLDRNMEDFARALRLIRDNAARFNVNGERYITCGFSAGGYLVCLWNTGRGYARFGLTKPQAVFPIYPVTSLREGIRYVSPDDAECRRLYGCSIGEALASDFEIPDHVDAFPPAAIFLAAGDELVSPENSRLLAAALERRSIPCRLEIGPTGGHGFADGSGMCMAGWTERAVRWYESLPNAR
ncbi:MAG: alpha/beta hydrolase [Clostridia bacterium]|nr:alpha/beta hydrolase [Clostridia bacterium]